MHNRAKNFGSTPQENLVSILPAVIAGIIVLAATIITVFIYFEPVNEAYRIGLTAFGVIGSLYMAFYYFLFTASVNKPRFAWSNAVITAFALGLMTYVIPREIDFLLYALLFITALSTSLISSRGPAYFLILAVTGTHFITNLNEHIPAYNWITYVGLIIAIVMAVETIQQLKNLAHRQINRLEVINELSTQIVYTLETQQLLSLLNAAFQNALEADTYYIGIVDGEDIHMQLFYDDGEYFNDIRVKRKGSLSNWVINNQRPLFLSDLRQPIVLEGVEVLLVGKQKNSLSWMGVPMRGTHVDGVMVIGSYNPNAFDRSDLELLSNIAQRAILALDNTYHHAHVQKEARLDSLTRVYNHGYFIQALREKAETCRAQKQPLGLIMLDIDHFKKYNDRFGHQMGDEILVRLCEIIRSNIKQGDVVGRWGGEEFAIALPNTDAEQALQIAQRIRETLAALKLNREKDISFPIPTVSQGLAMLSEELNDITRLIDIADKRLYVAKERGRDQIEPAPSTAEPAKTD
jgi:diguanylate cyclase (GGDEF)-like protein